LAIAGDQCAARRAMAAHGKGTQRSCDEKVVLDEWALPANRVDAARKVKRVEPLMHPRVKSDHARVRILLGYLGYRR
jgi:hypothetical protein